MAVHGVGMIGYGFIGKVHAWSYHNLSWFYNPPPLAVKLVGVATSSQKTASAAQQHGGFEMGTADWRELIARRDISIIDIASPNAVHKEQLLAAMKAGKHIYCDKPLVVTAEEAREIERALPSWGGIGHMTFQNRFFAATLRAHQLLEEGFVGKVLGMRGVYLHAGSVDPSVPMKWKLRKSEGGGVIRDIASHLLDLMDWLAGPIQEVSAVTRILHPKRPDGRGGMETVDAEDQVVMTVRLAAGALGTLEASKIAAGAEDDLRFEITGDRGALRFNLMDPDFLEAYSLGDPDSPLGGTRGWKRISAIQRYGAPSSFPPPRSTSGWLRAHAHCLYTFLQAVADGKQGEPSLARGVAVQRMMDAVERAAETGTWQSVR